MRESDHGHIKEVVLDFESEYRILIQPNLSVTPAIASRFLEHISILKGHCENTTLFTQFKKSIIHYMTTQYLAILNAVGHCRVYYEDNHIGGGGGTQSGILDGSLTPEHSITCDCESEEACSHWHRRAGGYIHWGKVSTERFHHSETHGFDMFQVITQGTINDQIQTLWAHAHLAVEKCGGHTWTNEVIEKATCLAEWSLRRVKSGKHESLFTASFKAPCIQLITKEGSSSVYLYIIIEGGSLQLLDDKSCPAEL